MPALIFTELSATPATLMKFNHLVEYLYQNFFKVYHCDPDLIENPEKFELSYLAK